MRRAAILKFLLLHFVAVNEHYLEFELYDFAAVCLVVFPAVDFGFDQYRKVFPFLFKKVVLWFSFGRGLVPAVVDSEELEGFLAVNGHCSSENFFAVVVASL